MNLAGQLSFIEITSVDVMGGTISGNFFSVTGAPGAVDVPLGPIVIPALTLLLCLIGARRLRAATRPAA